MYLLFITVYICRYENISYKNITQTHNQCHPGKYFLDKKLKAYYFPITVTMETSRSLWEYSTAIEEGSAFYE